MVVVVGVGVRTMRGPLRQALRRGRGVGVVLYQYQYQYHQY